MSTWIRLTAAAGLGAAALAAPSAVFAAPPKPARKAEPGVTYVVVRGDTLYDLAARHLLRVGDYRVIQRRNRIADPRRMRVGLSLDIPVALLRTSPMEARVVSYRGEATAVVQGRTLPISMGLAFSEGAVIATGANAFVRLELPDGSQVALPSQSRIRIDRLRGTSLNGAVDRVFSLQAGRSEAIVIPMKRPQDGFSIRTPLSVTAVRGTTFRVIYDAETQRAWTEVVTGTVSVDSAVNSSAALVPVSFGSSASAAGVGAPSPLLKGPTIAQVGRLQDDRQVVFDMAPVPGAVRYRARLALDAGLLDLAQEITSAEPRIAFDGVANGDWFVQVSALDAEGLEGMPSTYGFSRFRHGLTLRRPTIAGGERHWLFQWEGEGEGRHTYRFQLSKQPDGVPLVDEAGLADGRMTVTDLPNGDYYWRVQSSIVRDGRRLEKWSQVQQFRIGD